jgi:hypothetical protein
MEPFSSVRAEQIENALAPPPLGSTATKKCCTLSLRRTRSFAQSAVSSLCAFARFGASL